MKVKCALFMAMAMIGRVHAQGRDYTGPAPTDVFGNCANPCPELSFCGIDDNCHEYNCENFHKHGHEAFTVNDPNNTVELDCVEIDVASGSYPKGSPYAIQYGCKGFTGSVPPPEIAVVMGFNRKCTATTANLTFECSEMLPNTDFTPFLKTVNDTIIDCSDFEGNITPIFFYKMAYSERVNSSVYTWVFGGFSVDEGRKTFNSTRAQRVMYSTLWESTPTPTASPTPSPINASMLLAGTLAHFIWVSLLVKMFI